MKKIAFSFLIISTLLFSCEEDSITIEGVTEIEIPDCNVYPLDEYRIEDQSAMNVLFNTLFANGTCEPFTIPQIDFDESSLLGFQSTAPRCDNIYSYDVSAIPDENRYEFTTTVRQNMDCMEEEIRMNWVTLSKIPVDFVVEYQQDTN